MRAPQVVCLGKGHFCLAAILWCNLEQETGVLGLPKITVLLHTSHQGQSLSYKHLGYLFAPVHKVF